MRCCALLFFENSDFFFPIDGNRNRLTQFPVTDFFFGRLAFPHHGIEPIKSQVPQVRFHGFRVGSRHQKALTGIHARNLRTVVIPLQEFARHGHRFFFHRHHVAIHERQRLTAVFKESFFPIARRPFTRIRHPVIEGISFKNMLPIRARDRELIGAGTHGPSRERHAVRLQEGISVIKRRGFPRHRRKKSHREPI